MLAVPPAILDLLHLRVGATVNLSVEEGCLIIWRQAKARYTLDELLAQCDPAAPRADEDRSWLDVTPVARES
jgi:antitoxin ChpS